MNAPAAPRSLFASWIGFVLAAAGAVVALWFLQQVVGAILLLFFAGVVAIALSAPVTWFMRRGLTRHGAALLTLALFFGTIILIAWLVIPRLVAQIVLLANNLPRLIGQIQGEVSGLLENYPELQSYVRFGGGEGTDIVPAAVNLFAGVSAVSLSLLGGIALALIFFSTIVYIVLDPKPLIRGYLASLPVVHRAAGLRAYRRAQRSVIGWSKASLAVGALQAVAVFIFLSLMHIPGALVWAALAFFADFIPRVGG